MRCGCCFETYLTFKVLALAMSYKIVLCKYLQCPRKVDACWSVKIRKGLKISMQ